MQELTILWAKALVARRQELGLSQKALAELAATTQQHLSNIEKGGIEPRADLRQRLARALEIEHDELFRSAVAA